MVVGVRCWSAVRFAATAWAMGVAVALLGASWLPTGAAHANEADYGISAGKQEFVVGASLEQIQALLRVAKIPLAADGENRLLGEATLKRKSYPIVGRLVRDGLGGVAYFELETIIETGNAARRAALLEKANRLTLAWPQVKLAVTDANELIFRFAYPVGRAFNRESFNRSFSVIYPELLGQVLELPSTETVTGFADVADAMGLGEAQSIVAGLKTTQRPAYKARFEAMETAIAALAKKASIEPTDEDCDWCLVEGSMLDYVGFAREQYGLRYLWAQVNHSLAPTFGHDRDIFLDIVNGFNLEAKTPARAILAGNGDIMVDLAYSVIGAYEPEYLGELAIKAMPETAYALMDRIEGKEIEAAVKLPEHKTFEADVRTGPQRMVGRVIVEIDGDTLGCTGVLVATNLVLTAAHCANADDEATGQTPEIDDGVFQLAYRDENWVEEADIEEVIFVDGYGKEEEVTDRTESDWAILRLDENLPFDAKAFEPKILKFDELELASAKFTHFGYGSAGNQDTEEMLGHPLTVTSWTYPHGIGTEDDAPPQFIDETMMFAGHVVPGDSGGPVFMTQAGRTYLVGIAVAYIGDDKRPGRRHRSIFDEWRFGPTGDIAVVVPTAVFIDELRRLAADAPAVAADRPEEPESESASASSGDAPSGDTTTLRPTQK